MLKNIQVVIGINNMVGFYVVKYEVIMMININSNLQIRREAQTKLDNYLPNYLIPKKRGRGVGWS